MTVRSLPTAMLAAFVLALLTACSAASPTAAGTGSTASTGQDSLSYTRDAAWTADEASNLGGSAPAGWSNAPGWTISGAVTQVFGLKSGLAVVANGILTTYDRHSQVIAQSTPSTEITQNDSYAYTAYENKHPYFILTAQGPMRPVANSTSKTYTGVYYAIFDAEDGKLLFQATWEGTSTTLQTETAGGGVFIIQNDSTPQATKALIDPATGKVESPKPAPPCLYRQPDCSIWAGRYDGIDLYNVNESVKAATWSIPGGVVGGGGAGPFANISPSTGRTCTVVDAHTGQQTPWSSQNPGLCVWALPDYSVEAPFFGVTAMKASSTSNTYVYVDTATGASVSLAADDTFVGHFIGADGKVYGTATPTSGDPYPAVLDLTTKKATILTQVPNLAVVAASGDGILVLKANGSGLASTSDPSRAAAQQLYVLTSRDGTR